MPHTAHVVIAALDPLGPWIRENRPVTSEKLERMRRDGDVQALRAYWTRFAHEVAAGFERQGWRAQVETLQRWDMTPAVLDAYGADLIMAPHTTALQFGPSQTPALFYMQVMQRWLFTVDQQGWGPATTSYPCVGYRGGDAHSGVFESYAARLSAGNVSKFAQPPSESRAQLLDRNALPSAPFIFFPLQIPHDESLTLFSTTPEADCVAAVSEWALSRKQTVVFKEHPANRRAMATLRDAIGDHDHVFWSDASIHDLIRECSAVYTMNSGVGFEALFHTRPIATFAAAEYDVVTVNASIDQLDAAWAACCSWDVEQSMMERRKFVDWYCRQHAFDLSDTDTARAARFDQLARQAHAHAKRR